MISRKAIHRKSARISLIFAFFGVIILLTYFLDGAFTRLDDDSTSLIERYSSRLPIIELSGLFLDRQQGKLYGIGDADSNIAIADFNLDSGVSSIETLDLSQAIVDALAPCNSLDIPECARLVKGLTSQWEGISVQDKGQQILLLNEQLSTIFAIDRQNLEIRSLLNLHSYALGDTSRRRVSIDQANALAEGFVMLTNGRMLVIKERYPASIVEFAREEGAAAHGYRPGMQLPSTQRAVGFEGGRSSWFPTKRWRAPAGYENCDLSELTTDHHGQMFLLSQSCRWIARIAPLASEDSTFQLSRLWQLPKKIQYAEALVVIDDHHFMVGEDLKSLLAPNLHILAIPGEKSGTLMSQTH